MHSINPIYITYKEHAAPLDQILKFFIPVSKPAKAKTRCIRWVAEVKFNFRIAYFTKISNTITVLQ